MLELAILGLLKERAMHGYELRKQLSQKLGLFWTVSFGSLYPTLRRLEKRSAVEKVFPPDQASRRKQVYRITERGEREFMEMLAEGTGATLEEDKFSLRLAFFRYLKPEMRLRLLERRKAYLEDKLDEGQRSLSRAKRGRADSYTLSLMRHGMHTTQADITWLDELITAESAALHDPQPEPSADGPMVGPPTVDPTADPAADQVDQVDQVDQEEQDSATLNTN